MDHIISYLPVILSLIIIEGLLSVDNAMIIAAMVNHLPEKQQKLALRAGLIGAYVLRGVALMFAAFLIANPWIRIVGAAYLVYIMAKHLDVHEEGEKREAKARKAGFWATVVQVELVDLGFSIDNVIAAVALSKELWAVAAGVFIGMLAMRFVAGTFVKLMKKYPVLETVAYLLVGYVGLQLLAEEIFHFHVGHLYKFGMIVLIMTSSLIYGRVTFLQKVLGPLFRWLGRGFNNLARIVDWAFEPLAGLFGLLARVNPWRKKNA
jgi:tellurite resistance protein TerC